MSQGVLFGVSSKSSIFKSSYGDTPPTFHVLMNSLLKVECFSKKVYESIKKKLN